MRRALADLQARGAPAEATQPRATSNLTRGRGGGIGWFASALYTLGIVLSRLSAGRCRLFGYRFFAQPVADRPLVRSQPNASMRVDRVSPDDPITSQFPRPSEVIARRFAEGAVCFVARSGDRFAGFIWLMLAPYEEDEVRCRYIPTPAETTSWDYDVYVVPDFRMSRAFLRLWDAANAYLHDNGITWTVSRISMFNPSSLGAHARLGVRGVGTAVFVRLGVAEIAFFSMPPHLHVSRRIAKRPVVTLRAPTPNGEATTR
jgi:hypothetical protein